MSLKGNTEKKLKERLDEKDIYIFCSIDTRKVEKFFKKLFSINYINGVCNE